MLFRKIWSSIGSKVKIFCTFYTVALVLCLAKFPDRVEEYSPNKLACKSQSNVPCSELPAFCIDCEIPADCYYGQGVKANCKVITTVPKVECKGNREFTRNAECKYCWQTEGYSCKPLFNCSVWASPTQQMQKSVCLANDSVICMGRRAFYKRVRCNWTSGYKWHTALLLSITLGGFGADRFYLGLWQSGLGKLFSFGGVGVWTLIDVILIGTGYIGPADKSVYMP